MKLAALKIESVQYLNSRLGIQTKVQIWPLLIKTASYFFFISPVYQESHQRLENSYFKSNFSLSKINGIYVSNISLGAEFFAFILHKFLVRMLQNIKKMSHCTTYKYILNLIVSDMQKIN